MSDQAEKHVLVQEEPYRNPGSKTARGAWTGSQRVFEPLVDARSGWKVEKEVASLTGVEALSVHRSRK